MGSKIDTQAVGLDIGLSFVKWLTGAENLHYGLWDGLDVNAGNLGAAQAAYTTKLFKLLPEYPCRILDIGGGAGETARKLMALGHTVEIVVPSAFLAERCRQTAPGATVHEMTFEAFSTQQSFDICLFSESFQYIPLPDGLPRALNMLAPGGAVIVSDLFRTDAYFENYTKRLVGGGHPYRDYRAMLENLDIIIESEEDITLATAPSVEIEQGLFNVVGFAHRRVDQAFADHKPFIRRLINGFWRLVTSQKKRSSLDDRLNKFERNREVFTQNNIYVMMKIRPS